MAEVTTIYAGPLAEARYHDDAELYDEWDWFDYLDNNQEDAWETCTDWKHIIHARPKLGRRWRLHMDRAWARAVRIVRDHPAHIEALAAALLERSLLDGEEVFAILDAGPPVA